MTKCKIDIQKEKEKKHLEEMIKKLDVNKDRWANLDIKNKIKYLEKLKQNTAILADQWVQKACQAKNIDFESPLANEEWLSGPFALIYILDIYISSLQKINAKQLTCNLQRSRKSNDGKHLIAEVFPHNRFYKLLFSGVKIEVWFPEGIDASNLSENIASFYKKKNPKGKTAVVLGAGNIASIPPFDSLHRLLEEGHVVILKMNPVNEYLGPIFAEIFNPLIIDGFFAIVCGGADLGSFLTRHPKIESIHLTGSEKTFNTIVFGSGRDGENRRKEDRPVLDKDITAELGGVGPSIVVPGPWTQRDIRFQAEKLLIQKMHNDGCNCIASQVIITPSDWNKTPILMKEIKRQLIHLDKRKSYYPGIEKRISEIENKYPGSEQPFKIPLIENIPYDSADEYCFKEEFFAPVWAQTSLPGKNADEFLDHAISFCNDTLHGSLGANIIIHPQTVKELGDRFEYFLSELRYGAIGVNIWTGGAFLLTQASWGAFPGNTRNNAESGIGHVHNALLFDHPEKSIAYASFYPFPRGLLHGSLALLPKPPWFLSNKKGHIVGRKITEFQAKPGILKLPGIIWAAITG